MSQADYELAAQTQARLTYFTGMSLGLAGLALVTAILEVGFLFAHLGLREPGMGLLVFFTGMIGAAVSVMARMSFGRLALDIEAGTRQLSRLGVVRPLIGGFFALVVVALIVGGLLPVRPPSQATAIYFYGAVGFIAGFSERFAQDMLVTATRGLAGSSGREDAFTTNKSKRRR